VDAVPILAPIHFSIGIRFLIRDILIMPRLIQSVAHWIFLLGIISFNQTPISCL